MSRSGYSDDNDGWTLIKWRGMVASAIRGQRGQAFLRDLVAALDAMPEHVLAAEVFVAETGCCAMGAVALRRGLSFDMLVKLDEYDRNAVGNLLDIAPALAAEIAYENDEWSRGDDEDRWHHMRNWAVANIHPKHPGVDTPTGQCSWCCDTFKVKHGVINKHCWHGQQCPGVGLPERTIEATSNA